MRPINRIQVAQTIGLRHGATILLAIAILTLQLCTLGFHHHALTEKADDCASCQLAAEDLPPLTLLPQQDLPASLYVLICHIARMPMYVFVSLISPYLAPYSQAPPAPLLH